MLFYCLNGLHSFRTKNKLELHKKIWEKKVEFEKNDVKKFFVIKLFLLKTLKCRI